MCTQRIWELEGKGLIGKVCEREERERNLGQ